MNHVDEIIRLLKDKFVEKVLMFDCYDEAGDTKETLYNKDEIKVLYCPFWDYVEVVGLSPEDYQKILDECGYSFRQWVIDVLANI